MAGKRGRPSGALPGRVGEVAPIYGGIEGVLSRLEALVAVLGNNRIAEMLGVSNSQPSRWRARRESPGADMQVKILDLDHLMARLFGEMHPVVAQEWLEGYNHYLGARPIDVLILRGSDAVLAAVRVEAQGGFV